MTDITIAGNIYGIETHLAGYGLAAILGGDSRIGYDGRKVTVSTPLSEDAAGEVIISRVRSAIQPHQGWGVRGSNHDDSGVPVTGSSTGSYCSPFLSKALFKTPEDVRERYRCRDLVISELDDLDSETVIAMGKPQYWRGSDNPRDGATQIMPAAGDGGREQWVANTLGDAVRAGVHELDGNQALSDLRGRSADRLSSSYEWSSDPGPFVKTIVAMYGVNAMPTSITKGVPSRTPGCGYVPRTATNHSPYTILPVFDNPVSLYRVRGVIGHSNWMLVEKVIKDKTYLQRSPSERAWVREQGVAVSMVFTPMLVKIGAQMTIGRFGQGVEHLN